ncbi:MAG TPA: exodeoxyribonuclease VII large subunit [Lachnospiraceae bacterium]|nr:exodeoxyribonuclease VII large subunit [Lachnospiraceae bacterium]
MNNTYSVSQVNSYIKNMFTQDFMLRSIYVKGELSNVKYHSSGHIYFTLKDEKSAMSCVMFQSFRSGLSFRLTEGQSVVALGAIDVYEREGRYQLYAREILLDGVGILYERYERLKKELLEMGLFDSSYKLEIPAYSMRVGIVTAGTGAAIRDIVNISTRRNPYVELILYPARVQGEGAAQSIVKGIRALERVGPDVIIIGRGGGSIEDLWAFNEEEVARAVFDCSIPIISAVGHETDTTISDYVADLRAPTPSAAAELAVFSIEDFDRMLEAFGTRLRRAMLSRLDNEKSRLLGYRLRLRSKSAESRLREIRMFLASGEDLLNGYILRAITEKRNRLTVGREMLKGLSPLSRLKSGYALVEGDFGVVGMKSSVKAGDRLRLHMINRDLGVTVNEVCEVDRETS